MKCPNCGNDIPSVAKFCPKCGKSIPQMSVEGPDHDKVENNGKKPFEWKEKHTYIAIGAGLVLALIIGLGIRISKSDSVKDSYIAAKQDSDQENEYDYYEEENVADSDTDSSQESFYEEENDEENNEEMIPDSNDEEFLSMNGADDNTAEDIDSGDHDAEDLEQSAYILPGSDSRYLDAADLYDLSAEECRLARNELYARHGRKFDDEGLRAYFESKDWYSGTIDPSDFKEGMLNDYEVYNRDLIVEYEKEQGYR